MRANQQTIDQVMEHFDRLGVSVNEDPCSGLLAESDDDGVRIYDDHVSDVYCPIQLLSILEGCQSATPETIWQIIEPAVF